MKLSTLLASFLESRIGRSFPARIRNPLYRTLVDELVHQSKREARSHEILDSPPVACDPSSELKVATLVSSKDVEMLFWCLKSLFHFSGRVWDLCIIDGGLTSKDAEILRRHFPHARIYLERDLVQLVGDDLSDFQFLRDLRFGRGYAPAKKIVDAPRILKGRKFLLLDSDVLFFRNPIELIGLLESNEQRFAFSVDQRGINSGVAVVPSDKISFAGLEGLLRSMRPDQLTGWWIEQDLYEILSSECFDRLPDAYAVEPIGHSGYGDLACCHFIHVCRHRFYTEGIAKLRQMNFLSSLKEKYV